MKKPLLITLLGAFTVAGSAEAQQPSLFFIEGRGGVVAPTFDIADVATIGGSFGATVGVQTATNWVFMGAFDYGMHQDEPTETVDITTLHYMGKIGYSLTGSVERGVEVVLNLGAGAVTFDVEGAPDTFTYFAINAGGKVVFHVSPSFALVLSPQGDIAFSDETEVDTDNAWVWPLTAGIRLTFR